MIFKINQVKHENFIGKLELFVYVRMFGEESRIFYPRILFFETFTYITKTNCVLFSDREQNFKGRDFLVCE